LHCEATPGGLKVLTTRLGSSFHLSDPSKFNYPSLKLFSPSA
jgi:hypothetical protein